MRTRKLLIILLAVLAVFVWNNRRNAQQREIEVSKREGPGGGLEQKVLSFSIDGRSPKGVKQWHLEGNSALLVEDEIHLNDLKAVAYSDNATVNLTSDKGIYNRDKGEVQLMGNVKVTSDQGVSLTTEKARWSQHTKEISTDVPVRIEHEKMIATGTGGKANSDERTARLDRDVTVKIEPQTEVKCDGAMEVDYGNNVAFFYDNVHVTDADGEMLSDKLMVDFDPDTRKIAKVTAEGNVRLKKGKSYTVSEKAIYTESTKSAKLLGNPRIIIDPQEISAMRDQEGRDGDYSDHGQDTTILDQIR